MTTPKCRLCGKFVGKGLGGSKVIRNDKKSDMYFCWQCGNPDILDWIKGRYFFKEIKRY